jgi:hypothetical protein
VANGLSLDTLYPMSFIDSSVLLMAPAAKGKLRPVLGEAGPVAQASRWGGKTPDEPVFDCSFLSQIAGPVELSAANPAKLQLSRR